MDPVRGPKPNYIYRKSSNNRPKVFKRLPRLIKESLLYQRSATLIHADYFKGDGLDPVRGPKPNYIYRKSSNNRPKVFKRLPRLIKESLLYQRSATLIHADYFKGDGLDPVRGPKPNYIYRKSSNNRPKVFKRLPRLIKESLLYQRSATLIHADYFKGDGLDPVRGPKPNYIYRKSSNNRPKVFKRLPRLIKESLLYQRSATLIHADYFKGDGLDPVRGPKPNYIYRKSSNNRPKVFKRLPRLIEESLLYQRSATLIHADYFKGDGLDPVRGPKPFGAPSQTTFTENRQTIG